MAIREPPVEQFYDPTDLDPDAPRLYVLRNGETWDLQDEQGTILSTHPTQSNAIDAALARSAVEFCEILARGSTGRIEWLVEQDPEILRILQCLRERESSRGRRRIGVGVFWGHHVLLPARRRYKDRDAVIVRAPELYYDPAELDASAPLLRISKNGGEWELRDSNGVCLSSHARLVDALDAAADRSAACFSEILVRSSSGRHEWSFHHNPDWVAFARAVSQPGSAPRRRWIQITAQRGWLRTTPPVRRRARGGAGG